MSLVLIVSIGLRLFAAGCSVAYLWRLRDWRMGVLTLMLLVMASRQALAFLAGARAAEGWELDAAGPAMEWLGLAVSIMAPLVVACFGTMLTRARSRPTNGHTEQTFRDSSNPMTERNRQATVIRQSEARNHALLKAIPDFMFRINADGVFLDYLANREDQLLRPPSEFMGKLIHDCMPKELADLAMRGVRAALATGKMQSMEYRIANHAKTGEPTDFEARFVVSSENEVMAIVRDITVRKKAEEQLRLQSQLLDSVRESIMATDLEGHVIFWGKGAESLYGYGADEVMGRPITFLVAPGDETEEWQRMQQVLDTGTWRGTYRQRRQDGSEFWADTVISLVRDGKGEPCGFVGIDRDISDQKQGELALRESEIKFRVLSEQSPAVIGIFQGTRWVYANPAAELATGYTREELMKMDFMDLVHPDYRDLVRDRSRRRQQGLPVPSRYEIKSITKQGEERWADFSAGTIEFEGKPAVIGISVDVTDRKRAEEQLRQREAQMAHVSRLSTMGELVAGIAHEVNQPLYSVVNYAKACSNVLERAEASSVEQLRRWNEEIARAAHRAGEIIKRLHRFARRTQSELMRTDIHAVVRESIELVSFEARRCGVRTEVEPASRVPSAMVDRVQIQQVLVNLLKNAYEAMEEAGTDDRRVSVHTVTDRQVVEVVVSDNGPGLPAGDHAKLFDAFYTTKTNGMGMGLAISKTIVEAHTGRLWASPGQGCGATFHFTLPVCEETVGNDG